MPEEEKVHPMVQTFPATTRKVMEYYLSDASSEEKEMVSKAVQGASKIITTTKKADQPKAKKAKVLGMPTSDEVATALYSVLSECPATKVNGKPDDKGYTKTVIEGQFDLNEVARKLLSLGKRQVSSKPDWL